MTIKHLILILSMMPLMEVSLAQEKAFYSRDSLDLSMFDGVIQSEWADFNHDTRLDIILLVKYGEVNLPLLLSLNEDKFSRMDTIHFPTEVGEKFIIEDMDNNGSLDYLYTIHEKEHIYVSINYQQESKGIFENSGFLDSLKSVSSFGVLDFDNDGKKDIIFFGEEDAALPVSRILRNKGENLWETIDLDIPGFISNHFVFDANSDGLSDIFLLASENNQPVSKLLFNSPDGFISSEEQLPVFLEAVFSYGDLNHDGNFDLMMSGFNEHNQATTVIRAGEDLYIEPDSLRNKKFTNTFMADLNSDGISDLSLFGSAENSLILSEGSAGFEVEALEFNSLQNQLQKFGDYDWDGDLDLFVFENNTIILLKNTTEQQNNGPTVPEGNVAFSIKDEVKIFWQSSIDDHSPTETITYDVYIGKEFYSVELLGPNFDIKNLAIRSMVRHGNSGYREILSINDLPSGFYYYGIQSIDNAFYTLACQGGSGTGGGEGDLKIALGTFTICEETIYEKITVCDDQPIQMPGWEGAAWYSSSQGFLGFADTLTYTFSGTDTLYTSMNPTATCDDNKVWIINDQISESLPDELIICKGETVLLDLKHSADSLKWESPNHDFVSYDSAVTFIGVASDIIRLTAYYSECIFEDSVNLIVSYPELILNNKQFHILKGDNVRLSASGASHYLWSPAEGLNNENVGNPIASPRATTRYQVQAFDSLGCITIDSVLILVDDQAFIPNLFTPNSDSNNDILLIYGLNSVTEFNLKIFNRSGNIVFETSDPFEATNIGWDGTTNGQRQPNGVYYWKVSGRLDSGRSLLLGGKESGAVHLMR